MGHRSATTSHGGIAHLGAASIRRGDSSKETGPHLACNFFLRRFLAEPRSPFFPACRFSVRSRCILRTKLCTPRILFHRVRFAGTIGKYRSNDRRIR